MNSDCTYESFIRAKEISHSDAGLSVLPTLNPMLFDFQQHVAGWAMRKGRSAIFLDCGLGKTPLPTGDGRITYLGGF